MISTRNPSSDNLPRPDLAGLYKILDEIKSLVDDCVVEAKLDETNKANKALIQSFYDLVTVNLTKFKEARELQDQISVLFPKKSMFVNQLLEEYLEIIRHIKGLLRGSNTGKIPGMIVQSRQRLGTILSAQALSNAGLVDLPAFNPASRLNSSAALDEKPAREKRRVTFNVENNTALVERNSSVSDSGSEEANTSTSATKYNSNGWKALKILGAIILVSALITLIVASFGAAMAIVGGAGGVFAISFGGSSAIYGLRQFCKPSPPRRNPPSKVIQTADARPAVKGGTTAGLKILMDLLGVPAEAKPVIEGLYSNQHVHPSPLVNQQPALVASVGADQNPKQFTPS